LEMKPRASASAIWPAPQKPMRFWSFSSPILAAVPMRFMVIAVCLQCVEWEIEQHVESRVICPPAAKEVACCVTKHSLQTQSMTAR
jgi:hypothetical protein